MALERLEGPAGDFARRQTQRLRGDFAAALDRLGDHYWEDPKTRAFARDFYAQALIFAPDDEVALARGNFTIGALAQLREQAESSGFSSAEIEAAAPLKILADLDDPDLAAKIAALLDACAPPDEGALAAAGSGAGGASEVSPVAALGEPAPAEAAPEVAPEPEPEPAPPASDEAPEPAPAVAPAEAPPPSSAPEPAAKKRRSIDTEGLIARAESARRRGQDAEASRLFEQALTLAPRNPTALAALSDIAFDRGDFAEAAKLARKAIQVAPEIAEYHTRLGDALVKLRRKGEGLAAYERGLELGDARAKRRIELLEKGKL
ncbi:MAG: tetratricopeptide repeat protein [Myxococcales bacterium]|nr:tetratricopeptide repeat protein [Myxococcales bacterium]